METASGSMTGRLRGPWSSRTPGPAAPTRTSRAAATSSRRTAPACAYRDRFDAFEALGVRVFGLSTQSTDYQREAVERLHLPYALLSDDTLRFAGALNLPRFEHAGLTLLKRHTLVIDRGRIEHVLYPVFPSDRDAETVLAWLHGEAAPA